MSSSHVVGSGESLDEGFVLDDEYQSYVTGEPSWSMFRSRVISEVVNGPLDLLQWLREVGGVSSGVDGVNIVMEADRFERCDAELRIVHTSKQSTVNFDDCFVAGDVVEARAGTYQRQKL